MRKLIYLLLLIPFLGYGQEIKKIPRGAINNSRATGRINQTVDTVNAVKTIYGTDATVNDLNYIDFNLDAAPSHQEGRVHWNDDDKTLEAGLDQGSVLQIGQEIHLRSVNKTGSTILDGSVVYVSGAQGNRPTIALASDTSGTAILTLGVATQDIEDNTVGYVTLVGLVRGYDTRSFSAGDVLWLGTTPGTLVNVRPDAPNTAVTLGVALNSTEDGLIAVRPTVVQRMSWASDVNARGNQSNNDILVWNQDSLFWEYRDSLAVNAITYTDTYWDDLRVPLTNTRINPANSEPDFEDRGDGIFAWGFDADSDSAYVLNFIAQTPHNRKSGTAIEAHIHWSPSTTNTGSVKWRLIYSIASISGTFSTPDTLWVTDVADGTLKHQLADFGDLVNSSGLGISSMIMGSISRVGEDTEDTYTGSAYGMELDFHYEIDSPGSEEETEKY